MAEVRSYLKLMIASRKDKFPAFSIPIARLADVNCSVFQKVFIGKARMYVEVIVPIMERVVFCLGTN